jgi:diaminopimelate epimerase
MQKIEFYKMSGTGNDFILVDNRAGIVPDKDMRRIAERVCRRRDSVGADGMIYIVNSDNYDFKWRFFNSDGSEAEMCGNGSRCAARFALINGIAGEHMTFETIAGPVSADVSGRSVKVLMPAPKGLKIDIDIPFEEGWEGISFVNTGVPHVVVQVKDIKNTPVYEQGRFIRYHQMFQPAGTNANFMCLKGKDQIYVRTYKGALRTKPLPAEQAPLPHLLSQTSKGWLIHLLRSQQPAEKSLKYILKRKVLNSAVYGLKEGPQ